MTPKSQGVHETEGTFYLDGCQVGLTSSSQAFHILLKFLFRREDIHRPVSTLSGGEKSRIQLARLK